MSEFEYWLYFLEETKITAFDGDSIDYFGKSVSISGDGNTFIAGAYCDDDNGPESGSVYVYKWNGETWEGTKITAFDGDSYDYFGTSVSISGDGNTFIVGTPEDDDYGTNSGAVYVYR